MQPKRDRAAVNRENARARWDATPPERRAGMGRQGFAGIVRRLELAIPEEITDPAVRQALLDTAVREHMSGIGRLGGKARAAQVAAAELRVADAERRAADAERRAAAAEAKTGSSEKDPREAEEEIEVSRRQAGSGF